MVTRRRLRREARIVFRVTVASMHGIASGCLRRGIDGAWRIWALRVMWKPGCQGRSMRIPPRLHLRSAQGK